MEIDKTKPVFLKKIVPFGSNIFHPREYQPGELPEVLLSEDFVTQNLTEVARPIQAMGLREVTPMEITVTNSNTLPPKYPTDTVVVKPQTGAQSFGGKIPPEILHEKIPAILLPPTKTNINTAGAEEIDKLSGVSSQVATNILKEREKTLFKDVEDLQTRIPLAKGKWQEIADKISF